MAKNKLSDLRNHLFQTLEQLTDKDDAMDIDRAKIVALVAQTIINSATVEVKALNAFGQSERPLFFDELPAAALPPDNGNQKRIVTNGNSVRPSTQ